MGWFRRDDGPRPSVFLRGTAVAEPGGHSLLLVGNEEDDLILIVDQLGFWGALVLFVVVPVTISRRRAHIPVIQHCP